MNEEGERRRGATSSVAWACARSAGRAQAPRCMALRTERARESLARREQCLENEKESVVRAAVEACPRMLDT